ncbi:MAG: class I SAM-dependent methyltransferase, partial [Vicinamibacteria bacterium]
YPSPRILDLGCGVGASLSYLLERRPGEGFGITVSEAQVEIARARKSAVWLKGDFCEGPLPAPIDLAYGIESFVHARDPSAFFRNVSAALGFGARLVLVDDFLSKGSRDAKLVRRFIDGWHAPSLRHPHEVDEIAAKEGLALVSDRDLTPMLQLDRPRDWAIGLSVALLRPLGARTPRLQSLFGGNALRGCLKRGLLSYRFRVWEKREVS